MNTVIGLGAPLPPAMQQALARFGEVRLVGEDTAAMAGCGVYLITPRVRASAALISALPPSVGLLASLGVGTDHIDLDAAAARGLQVSNTPVVTEDTADLAWALLLATCRRLTRCEALLRQNDWLASQRVLGTRVHGKTLGIVGFGAIGQAVARRAQGFGMDLLYHGPRRKPEAEAELSARYCLSLDELLVQSDIVSLNCPLGPDTRHIINANSLARMKAGAVLINTGRGPLVDEAALVQALQAGTLGGAGLDVFEFEPQVTPALLDFDAVTLLPHIGSATGECRTDMALRVMANIQAWCEGRPVPDACVPA
ncbi:MAG: 2-hydroxyacid dehydrogenase [Parahaliea sp.]